jgi:hypothetical protein
MSYDAIKVIKKKRKKEVLIKEKEVFGILKKKRFLKLIVLVLKTTVMIFCFEEEKIHFLLKRQRDVTSI